MDDGLLGLQVLLILGLLCLLQSRHLLEAGGNWLSDDIALRIQKFWLFPWLLPTFFT